MYSVGVLVLQCFSVSVFQCFGVCLVFVWCLFGVCLVFVVFGRVWRLFTNVVIMGQIHLSTI